MHAGGKGEKNTMGQGTHARRLKVSPPIRSADHVGVKFKNPPCVGADINLPGCLNTDVQIKMLRRRCRRVMGARFVSSSQL